MMDRVINVVGGGLAGVEAAYAIARLGAHVRLYEMKPKRYSPAHHSPMLAELVCSNSLKGNRISNACGLLKEELRMLSSLCMESAEHSKVPAGDALAVDRDKFSAYITEKIRSHPGIRIISQEVVTIPEGITVIATGPLTSAPLAREIAALLGEESLYFYDAAAPIVAKDSIDMSVCYKMARYGKGTADYINCPFTKEQYEAFYQALIHAKLAPLHLEEEKRIKVFEGCMPVEVMAKRGERTLLFGSLKPVGLPDPVSGREYHAVAQLRQENTEDTMYNLVGFQTNLTFGEQKRVFSMIPGLQHAEFLRYGVMHRNTYINAPRHLLPTNQLKAHRHIFLAGQLTGVEGYVESMASGFLAGVNAFLYACGEELLTFPAQTALGALMQYITDETIMNFQPMNMNFGILPKCSGKIKSKQERYETTARMALDTMQEFISQHQILRGEP